MEKMPKHWPLTAADIIQERVEFEDRILHMHDPEPEPPRLEVKPLKLTPAAAFVLGRQMIRRGVSFMTP